MAAKRRGGRSRRGKASAYAAAPKLTLTSVPTGRAAYNDTRQWLLAQHGPVCAYCEKTVPVRTITLDHVTPRRGLTAYDRRDNLVLCCKTCNSAKADKPILVFLLGHRKRVIAMYKYGRHLSHQLVEMVNDLLPEADRPALPTHPAVPAKPAKRRQSAREVFGDLGNESPYFDEAPRKPAPNARRTTHGRSAASAKAAGQARPAAPARPSTPAKHAAPARHAAPAKPAAPARRPAAAAPAVEASPYDEPDAPKKRRSRRGGRGRKKKVASS